MFLKALIFSTSLLFCSLNFISSSTVSCNFLKNFNWGFGDWYTCFMQTAGPIHSTGFNILSERRENVSGLSFYGNKNISFLPESVSEVFPNLGGYDAGECNVKAIFKANFERLGSVRRLELQGNQIEVLEGNVFQDLTSLIRLRLGNKKFLNVDLN